MFVQQLCGLALFSILAVASSGATAPDYSKEAVVIQNFTQDVTFASDGTWRFEQSASVRIQSEAGVRQFGVLAFSYDKDNQSIEVVYVRVKKADGTVVATPPENIQDVSSEVTRVAPSYSDLREKQIPVKALGVGDILEYKIRFLQDKPEIPNQFWLSQDFLTSGVVLDETLRVAVPADKYVKVVSPKVKPVVTDEAGQKIYFWKTAQLDSTQEQTEAQKKKPVTPSVPAVELTTFRSWDELGRWYGQLEADRIAVTPAIQAKADELTKGLTTREEKERAIYNYVSTKFRYISVSFGVGRYQPHSAQEVLSNQYGDCKDKHTLFASLLKAAGIDAWPALIGSGIKLDPDLPSPAQFNHVITVVPEQKEYVWLDTTPEVASYRLLVDTLRDEKALVIPSNGPAILMTTPSDTPFPSSQTLDVTATLSADGTLKGHFDVIMRGDTELLMRSAFHQVSAAQWQELVQTLVRSLGFAGTVSNVDVDNPENLDQPFHYAYDYVRDSYADWSNLRITPPLFFIGIPFTDDQDKPVEPIDMGGPATITYSATVRLPANFSAEIPDSTNVQSEFATYTSRYTVAGGVLSAKRQLLLKKAKVPVSAWEDYRVFAKRVVADQNNWIQLASTGSVTSAQTIAEAGALVREAIRSGTREKTIDALRTYIKLCPDTEPGKLNAVWQLAIILNQAKRYSEVPPLIHDSFEKTPDNPGLQVALSEALLRSDRKDEGLAIVRQTAATSLDGDILNNLAWELADTRADLSLAKQYAEKSISIFENQTKNASLSSMSDHDLQCVTGLAAAWDTLGWVYFRLGDTQKAETYIDASWRLAQHGDVADHLGQIYEQVGRKDAAIHMWQLALAADHHSDDVRARLRNAGVPIDPYGLRLAHRPNAAGSPTSVPINPNEELGKLRTTGVPDLQRQEGSAEFFVLFSMGKVEEVQFISGADALKLAGPAIEKARFDMSLPDEGPEKIIRQGVLSCSRYTSPNCQFVLFPPDITHK